MLLYYISAAHLGGGGQRGAEVRARVSRLQGGRPGRPLHLLLHRQGQLGGPARPHTADQATTGLPHTSRHEIPFVS